MSCENVTAETYDDHLLRVIRGEFVLMDWLKKAPTAVTVTAIIVCGVVVASLVAAFVVLTINGADTAEFRQWVSTLGQLLVFPLLGTTAVASVAAARSSSKAEDQTNGQLEQRDEQINSLRAQLAASENNRLRTLGQLPENRRTR